MKKLFLVLLVTVLGWSCSNEPEENTMIVNGRVKGLKKGVLYLQYIPDSVLVTIDSLQIQGDENFSFNTTIESPQIFYLYLDKKDNNDINDRITFFGEPGTITINTSWNTFDTQADISGSESHAKFEEYRKVMSRFNSQNLEIIRSAYDPEVQQDSIALDSIQSASERNIRRGYLYALNFALNNSNSFVSPFIAVKEVPDAKRKYLDSIYKALPPAVAASKYGKELEALLKSSATSDEVSQD